MLMRNYYKIRILSFPFSIQHGYAVLKSLIKGLLGSLNKRSPIENYLLVNIDNMD